MKILVASPIDAAALETLRESHDVVDISDNPAPQLAAAIRDSEVLIFRSGVTIDARLLASAPGLRFLIRAGSGLDNIDLGYVREHGLVLQRVAEPGAEAVAELAFALMLAVARNLRAADAMLREGRWAKRQFSSGLLMRGKTLGVYGCGNIGRRVARMGIAWGMHAVACTREQNVPAVEREGIRLLPPEEVLARADFLSIHVPLNDETRHLIDADAISCMKRNAVLVNLARGGVVDENALYDALAGGRLWGAGVDVHEREGEGEVSRLAELPNVVLTPHIGSGTRDTQRRIGRRILEIVADCEAGGSVDGRARAALR